MRGLPKLSNEYFAQFRTTPLKLKPFDPKARQIGKEFANKLKNQLINIPTIEVALRGSILFGIPGKGDIDIAVRTTSRSFPQAYKVLCELFGNPRATGKTFAAFYIYIEKYEIEISLMKGHEAVVDKVLTDYLCCHPDTLREYVELKEKYCISKREYLIQRNRFMQKVIRSIP